MRKVGGIKIAIALLAAMAAGMPGQAAGLKSGPQKVKPLSQDELAEARAKLGECLYKHNQAMAGKMFDHSDSLMVDYKGMGVANPMFAFDLQACMKYNVPQMMGMVFTAPNGLRQLMLEQAYLQHFQSAPKPLLDAKGEPALAPPHSFASTGDKLPGAVAFAQIADCTAATGYEQADKLLRTPFGTPAEREAAIALAQSTLGSCIPEGQNISLTPASIRSIAAEGMWHRYRAAPQAQASAR